MEPSVGIWSQCLDVAALSDVGLRRANNQDSFAVALAGDQAEFDHRGHLFLVADGMGAHAAGELASKIAADLIPLTYRKLPDASPPEAIVSALVEANQQIHARGNASREFHGMGTTACALLLLPTGAIVAHVGDSRVYRLRGNRIEQLTFDHSLVWELRASGQYPSGELPSYVTKNIITRSLGPNPTVQVDLEGPSLVQAGDTFLLCSDGLSGPVNDDEIGVVLGSLSPAEAVQALIDLACLRGGPDNITAIVVRVLGPQTQTAVATPMPAVERTETRPIHPLVWTVLGASSLAALGLLAIGQPWAALAGLVVAVGAGAAALWQRQGRIRETSPDGRHFGRGPYVTCDCTSNADLLGRFADIDGQLRDAAVSENWAIDWPVFDGLLAEAAESAKRGDFAAAVRGHLLAIAAMMGQLRRQRAAASDSDVFFNQPPPPITP